jgi:hypothetical protein
VSAELVGPGDLIRPWQPQPARLLQAETRLMILESARFAILDDRFLVAAARYPEITAMLVDRLIQRTHRVAVEKAIAQLNGVNRRILALFWQIAERWGHVTSDGVQLRLVLPHRVIAALIGARRPTVSTALGALARQGQLQRLDDGTWLLRGDPVGMPDPDATRIIPTRRFKAKRTDHHAVLVD